MSELIETNEVARTLGSLSALSVRLHACTQSVEAQGRHLDAVGGRLGQILDELQEALQPSLPFDVQAAK